jgi:hypothetical protein
MSKEAKEFFLIECCRIAKGDTSLKIGIMRLLNSVKIDLSYKQAFDNIIPPPNFRGIYWGVTRLEEITLCRKSLYYVIKISGESALNFGMVSYPEEIQLAE